MPDLTYDVNNSVVTNIHECVGLFGIHLDEYLSLKSSCDKLISKLNFLKYLFLNLKSLLNKYQLISINYAKPESIFRYGICFWGNSLLSPNYLLHQSKLTELWEYYSQ